MNTRTIQVNGFDISTSTSTSKLSTVVLPEEHVIKEFCVQCATK